MNLVPVLTKVITQNEIGGNAGLIYKFSDADGLRTGKSGYSFGVCQFDIMNNSVAILCLKECGFAADEIAALKKQNCSIAQLNAKLLAHKEIVDKYDSKQIAGCINWISSLVDAGGFKFADDTAFIMACDYHNQFYASKGGKFFTFCRQLGKPVTAADILRYKLGTIWGKKRPDDVDRRYKTVIKVMAGI